jgi:hypothetical protein
MNWRIVTVIALGFAAAPFTYVGFRTVFERLMMPRDWSQPGYAASSDFPDRKGMAPVLLYDQRHVPGKAIINISLGMERMHEEALQIEAIKGQAFVADRLIPLDEVTNYINGTHVQYVVVTPIGGSVWKGTIPILDACRKSSVVIVFLNKTQSL